MAAVATVAVSGCAAPPSSVAASAGEVDYAAVADGILNYAESIVDDAKVPAVAIGVIAKDGFVEERFLGENVSGDPVTSETLFEIGSSTKAFLGVTQATLVDRGDLAWEDRVTDHYPEFEMYDPWVTEEFRVEDLLTQRSGMPGYSSETAYALGFPWADNVKVLKHVVPESSFRSTFAYQNIPHYVASEIVAEKVGAESWNVAVEDMLLEPAGMASTGASQEWLTTSEDSTRGHTLEDGELRQLEFGDFPSDAQGAGSLVSNLDDMAKWIGLHLNDGMVDGVQLVSEEQLRRTHTPVVPVTDPYFRSLVGMGDGTAQISYATGWFVHSMTEGRVIEHGGQTLGYNAAVLFDPDREVGIVVLSNQGWNGGAATSMGKYGMDLIQGREPVDYFAQTDEKPAADEASESSAAEPERALEAFEGVYAHELFGTFDIRADGDVLRTQVGPDAHDGTLERVSGDAFELTWRPSQADERGGIFVFQGESERPDGFVIDNVWIDRVS